MQKFSLDEIAGGELSEKMNIALQKVVENLLDPNTPYKNKRKICLTMSFAQNEDRENVTTNIAVETKLAPIHPTETHLFIGKDLRTGDIMAEEYGNQIKGQMSLADLPVPDDCDPETGEVIERRNVTEFKKAMEG